MSVVVPTDLRYHGSGRTRQIFDDFIRTVTVGLALGRSVKLDFSKTERLFPCGLLLFLGHLDCWVELHRAKLSCTYPENDVVEQMLQSAKVFSQLGLPPRKAVAAHDVIKWHQFEGHNADATPIEPFLEEVRTATGADWQLGLGSCIAEALTNVRKHAYQDKAASHWWMFATVNMESKRIFVAMHDRGDSIPATLLAKPEWIDQVTFRRLRRGGDCELISAAAGGRTRTRLYYRGKGLPEMVEFTERHRANALAIYSRRGYFVMGDGGSSTATGTLNNPVDGTLLIWTLNYGVKS
ncbi:hypothetical protein [Roseateles sp.]|uniref:hypothetical protein n=1 Tax=Roseateles sp. TaxID=1971397 RepID=UPI003BA8CC27